jgi:predicted secreted Zn-dependent protease
VLLPLLCVGMILGVVAAHTGWRPSATLQTISETSGALLVLAIQGTRGPNAFSQSACPSVALDANPAATSREDVTGADA